MRSDSALVDSCLAGCLSLLLLCGACASPTISASSNPRQRGADNLEELNEIKVLDDRAEELYRAGKYTEAIPFVQQSVELSEKFLGPEHPTVAASLNHLAILYKNTGQFAKAEPLFQRALAIRERASGAEHPATATTLSHLAFLYRAMGQYEKADIILVPSIQTGRVKSVEVTAGSVPSTV